MINMANDKDSAAGNCGGCEDEQVCGLEQLGQKICTYKDGTYAAGDLAIWEGCIFESTVNQMVDPTEGWVDVKSPDSEKQWKKLGTLEDLLKLLGGGCPLEVEKAVACMPVTAGEWRCCDGCYRQAKVDLVLVENADGTLNIPAAGQPANAQWSKCWTVDDVLNLLNDPKGISEIDDSDPANTTVTLNDGTVFTSPEQPDEDEDERYLTNPTINAAGTAYVWDVIVNGVKAGEVEQEIPGLTTNCAGDRTNGPFVGCDEFEEKLEEALEECLTIPDIGNTCGDIKKVASVVCAEDPTKESLVSYTDADISAGRLAYGTHGGGALGNVTPLGSYTYADYYNLVDLQNDHSADAIDMDKLNATRIFCGELTLPCDGTYNAYVEATIPLEGGTPDKRTGRFIVTMDGQFFNGLTNTAVVGTSDVIRPMSPFTNYIGEHQDDWLFQATAGTHTFCMYLIGWVDSIPSVQVNTAGGPPLMDISRAV